MAGRSCVMQLLTALEGCTALLQDGIPVDVVYLLSPHQHLLVKLQAHGITGKILNWIRVFLTHRRQ